MLMYVVWGYKYFSTTSIYEIAASTSHYYPMLLWVYKLSGIG